MAVSSGAAWPELWVPVAVVGHVFAAFWLLKGLLLTCLTLLHTCLAWCRCTKARGPAGQVEGETSEGAERMHEELQVGDDSGDSAPPQPSGSSAGCQYGSRCQQPTEATQEGLPGDLVVEVRHRERWKVAAAVGELEWRNLGCSYKGAEGTKAVLQVGGRGRAPAGTAPM